MKLSARDWLDRIRTLPLDRTVRVLNVCGGHERTLASAGLRTLIPQQIQLIPGPGCPVCICPEEDVFDAIHLSQSQPIILAAFGDMLRVPVNVPKGQPRSLEQARAAGADIRPIAGPAEAVAIAEAHPTKDVVFFAAGFETTLAPVAAMACQGMPRNLFLLVSGRLTWPAVAMLLASEQPGFETLVAPGHVATVMGPEEWEFVARDYGMPAAIAGFTPESLLAGIYSTLRQLLDGKPFLDNCYRECVRPGGTVGAKQCLSHAMEVTDATWRGIGVIPKSGFRLRPEFSAHNASLRYTLVQAGRPRSGEMPPGCDCARVILGKVLPTACKLYGTGCTPESPIGPCMVSDEGACRIWWSAGYRPSAGSDERVRQQSRARAVGG